MRPRLLSLLLVGCAPTIADVVADTDGADTDTDTDSEIDPRRDPAGWPDTLGPADRPAKLVTPTRYEGTGDLPVIVVLHGYTASGAIQDEYFELSERVDREEYVLIVPDGLRNRSGQRYWNATDVCCDFDGTGNDDVGYLLGLLDELETVVPIDPARITLIGHSNGGFMAHRLACDASDRIAGFISLAGANFEDPGQCAATEPVSALQVHGTLDPTIVYGGGAFRAWGPRYPGAEQSIGFWADRAGCDRPRTGARQDYDSLAFGDETEPRVWQDCDGVDVALWTMNGSGHIPGLTRDFHDAALDWLLAQRKVE